MTINIDWKSELNKFLEEEFLEIKLSGDRKIIIRKNNDQIIRILYSPIFEHISYIQPEDFSKVYTYFDTFVEYGFRLTEKRYLNFRTLSEKNNFFYPIKITIIMAWYEKGNIWSKLPKDMLKEIFSHIRIEPNDVPLFT